MFEIYYRPKFPVIRSLHDVVELLRTYKVSMTAGLIAGLVASGLEAYQNYRGYTQWFDENIAISPQAYSAFSVMVGIMLAFRNSQSYQRFWEGCTLMHNMSGDLYDASSTILSFTRYSAVQDGAVKEFQHLVVRLFSLLNAVMLAELEGVHAHERTYEVLDISGLDEHFLKCLHQSTERPEFVFMKIHQLIVVNMRDGVLGIPPPILTRAFADLSNGMVRFHEAVKLVAVPFPRPYVTAVEFVLLLHFLATPIAATAWTSTSFYAGIFAFTLVFLSWTLVLLANELDNPFCEAANDLDTETLQFVLNKRLAEMLIDCDSAIPRLSRRAITDPRKLQDEVLNSNIRLRHSHVSPAVAKQLGKNDGLIQKALGSQSSMDEDGGRPSGHKLSKDEVDIEEGTQLVATQDSLVAQGEKDSANPEWCPVGCQNGPDFQQLIRDMHHLLLQVGKAHEHEVVRKSSEAIRHHDSYVGTSRKELDATEPLDASMLPRIMPGSASWSSELKLRDGAGTGQRELDCIKLDHELDLSDASKLPRNRSVSVSSASECETL